MCYEMQFIVFIVNIILYAYIGLQWCVNISPNNMECVIQFYICKKLT